MQIKETFFAPAGRAEPAAVDAMFEEVAASALFQALLDAVDGYALVLNEQRQVLAANELLTKDLGLTGPGCLVGVRPGELFNCINARVGPDGCGTSRACSTCGAVLAIMLSQRAGKPAVAECLLTMRRAGRLRSLELQVRATPVSMGAHELTVVVLTDISGAKRRAALERVFFHDVLNTIGGLIGWSKLLRKLDSVDAKQAAERIVALSEKLSREVEAQRTLVLAELDELVVTVNTVPVLTSVLAPLELLFAEHAVAAGKQLEIAPLPESEEIATDVELLLRVLTNGIKNALEASEEGQTVKLWYEADASWQRFHIHNATAIPEEAALRIFQRSFTTKEGRGRGLGTYSMRLFTEQFLGGLISFESTEQGGTTFTVSLPRGGPAEASGEDAS